MIYYHLLKVDRVIGKKILFGVWQYCIFQSETFVVSDCYKYDSGIQGTANEIWSVSNGTLTRTSEYSELAENASQTAIAILNNIPYTSYHVEVDILQVDGTTSDFVLQISSLDWTSLEVKKLSKIGEWVHCSFDFTNLPTDNRLRLLTNGTMTKLRFKNFKMYSI